MSISANRLFARRVSRLAATVAMLSAVAATSAGCIHKLLLTPIYLIKGYNVPAAYDGLKDSRVAVVCRPPASLEFRHAGVDRDIAKRVGMLLAENVSDVDVVSRSDIEQWEDINGPLKVDELAEAVGADKVVRIDLEDFSLQEGQTLLQGRAEVVVTVIELSGGAENEVWDSHLEDFRFPVNGGVPQQDKSIRSFRRQFIAILSERIARNFYKHDPHLDFANDGVAHRR